MIVTNGYFPIALILSTLVPSSAPENFATDVAISTFASSGVKVTVISCFYFGARVPIGKSNYLDDSNMSAAILHLCCLRYLTLSRADNEWAIRRLELEAHKATR